ncbi:Holliday junction resolvase RuvX [Plasticicumulans sp.]|uniref:Holliday junction resolvase RuvX n=1 Tax=Plasticicumulans sp. TaxID=2307179 RepID=UPI002CA750E9|nr:Holliday junction resolvase RuvX [Plasticicumulans sp.]HMW29307.1 Holliday junction resolvase RuvX [Plasticicumulans sp.]HMZ11633.1 Holliday junction resolvase RuvX [Plasticicumulans sp.]HNE01720.1 Holliday junction resolvase RuvX [Plasticicumulans sp.]HNF64404.1 Holliday junction resolvase RuvX [Plasticicumulans sp.]HNG50334.1 Holliday junction resolvase RuvX [Plasticicumulans sp.]
MPASAPRPRTVLAFDYGSVRIGVAVGSELTGSARPLATLAGRDWTAIGRLIDEWRPDACVVGVPRHADGSESETTRGALRFARQLDGRYGLPVATHDERLSSYAAAGRLAAAPASRRRPGPGLDAAAAALILESWFATVRNDPPCNSTPNA